MPNKERYKKEKKIRETYQKDSLGDLSYSEFRKSLKKITRNNLI